MGNWLTKYPLGSYQIHFHRALIDRTPEVPQLKRHRGTVDFEMSRSVFRTFADWDALLFPESFRQRFVLLGPVAD